MFKTANNDSISRPNSRPKLPFPGNGKRKFKMPREGKGREIWGMYSRESRETGIPAHPWMRVSPLMRALATWLGWRILDRSAILLRPLNHEWYYHHHLQECNHQHPHEYLPNDAYLTFDFPPCCHCHRVVISLLMALKRTYQVNHWCDILI